METVGEVTYNTLKPPRCGWAEIDERCAEGVLKMCSNHVENTCNMPLTVEYVHKCEKLNTDFVNFFTLYPQTLSIESLLEVVYIMLNRAVIIHLVLDFFYRVDGGGVIFSPQFVSNFRETKVQFAS